MKAPPDLTPFDELGGYELTPGAVDPMRFAVLGRNDFVLGRVRRLIASASRGEILYLVVGTAPSNFKDGRGEERLVPLAWAELNVMRRQVRLPQLSPLAFRRLPLYHPGAPLPADIPFPTPRPDEVEFWDIA